jgi:TonB family protein
MKGAKGKFSLKGLSSISQKTPFGDSADGYFVLLNRRGETVRSFNWESDEINVIFNRENRRIETVADLNCLDEQKIKFDLLAETSKEKLQKMALPIADAGELRWVPNIAGFSDEYELAPEQILNAKKAVWISAAVQLGLAGLVVIAGFLGASGPRKTEFVVTMLPEQTIQKMLAENEQKLPILTQQAQLTASTKIARQNPRDIVVAPSIRKLRKNAPVPTHSTSFKQVRRHSKGPRGGGYKSDAPRGYGTNEPSMNSIGVLGALNSPRVKGGNGGRGGLNLQAVGTEPGSGAGGRGHGGFASNGGGGRGLGGLGTGRGQGLSNAMFGRGLIAASFGDGSPAPGSGGYGTRGRMGGGAQGAGYGTQTIVGSWKGTGPKGDGPGGSGVGNGDPNGSPYGLVDGDDEDAVVTGGLDMESIREIIYRNMGQIRYCYEQGLQRSPGLAGRVTVKFQIAGNGRVSLANVRHSSVRSSQVENCMVSKIRNWKFPKPHGGVNVAVVYPFNLQRTVSMR